MYKLKVYNNISIQNLPTFTADKFKIENIHACPDAILLRSHQLQLNEIPNTVHAIGRAGAGVNNIPVPQLSERGIPVFNTPGANSNAVKELVLAGLFIAARNICKAWQFTNQPSNNNDEFKKLIESGKKQFKGIELSGRTLGVIGLGAIGVKVANAAIELGMRVIGYDPNITVNRAWSLSANVIHATSLEEVLQQSEFITLHVPLNDETKNLISNEQFKMMPAGHILLNFSRAEIVDEQALITALNKQHCAKYVCDFPSLNIQNQDNVISLPHLGASTIEAEENCAVMIVEQLQNYLMFGAIKNSVNFPDIDMPATTGHRVTIANANIPNMVAQISGRLANVGLNIIDMINKSRNDIAYTIIDVDKPVPENTIHALMAVEGILHIRNL